MNGIIFQDRTVRVGCSAKFLFKLETDQRAIPAIAEFEGGEKAYAAIEEVLHSEVILTLGEYFTADGVRIPKKRWRLKYIEKSDAWTIVEKLHPK